MLLDNKNINILKKAYPHLDERRKKPISILLKLSELSECISEFSHPSGLESCSDANNQINTEELLKDIRSECPKQYRDIIDFVLNFSKTKDFYTTYKSINNITQSNPDFTNNIDLLKKQLSNEQLEQINELSRMINNMNN